MGETMSTLSENYETIVDLFPEIRWRAVLSNGDLTVELTHADIGHLERAVSKAIKGFKMKIVNLRPILDFTRNGDVDGYIIENYKLNSEFSTKGEI
jgi:uncharacterized protein YprB with RNaseH-like and TPR domain